MCGIAGVIDLTGRSSASVDAVRLMTNSMQTRGPDDEGILEIRRGSYEDEKGHAHRRSAAANVACLGHRRLAIIETGSAGHQPMQTEGGRFSIVYNGEIYNYRQIAQHLKNEGVLLTSDSDTEVLLKSFATWGKAALQRLNGDFAFAIWDDARQELLCARDRLGVKPFHYTLVDGQFIFASDIKALLASNLVSPQPDPIGLPLAMHFGMAPRPITAFRGIRALEQAHWMTVSPGKSPVVERYWSIPTNQQDRRMSFGEATELLEFELRSSVRRRLVADVPVGTFMSGGVDSTTISALAAQEAPGITAFTLGFSGSAIHMDETAQAAATAERNKINHVVEFMEPQFILDNLRTMIRAYEEPFHTLAANMAISELVKRHGYKVVLNGLGGDELFAGYSWYRTVRRWRAAHSARFLSRLPLPRGISKVKTASDLAGIQTPTRFHTTVYAKHRGDFVPQLLSNTKFDLADPIELVEQIYVSEREFADDVEAISYMDLTHYIGNHHALRSDAFTMAFSVEGRFPFLDHELIEASSRIPTRYKIDRHVQKKVLRAVASKHVDDSCLTMTKKGFGLPLVEWLQGPLKSVTEDALASLRDRDEVNPAGVPSAAISGSVTAEDIWHCVSLEHWFREFIDT